MGRLILCCGEKAEHPWYIKETDTKLYSMEELCYYIYNNIYIISERFFSLELVSWIEKELKLPLPAQKLRSLVAKGNSCRDMVVTVLCSTDYYTEPEIKELIAVMNRLAYMTEAQREKYKADLWLEKGRYTVAAMDYRKLLFHKGEGLSVEETGDVFHNLGITCLYTGTVEEAATHFWEAYGRNHKKESRKAYVQACHMAHIEPLQVSEEECSKVLEEFEKAQLQYQETSDYRRLAAAIEKKKEGQAGTYYEEIDQLLKEWKREYREKVG